MLHFIVVTSKCLVSRGAQEKSEVGKYLFIVNNLTRKHCDKILHILKYENL